MSDLLPVLSPNASEPQRTAPLERRRGMTGMIQRNAELSPIRPVGPGDQLERLASRPLTPHRAEHRMLAERLRTIDAFARANELPFKGVA